jgi:hypothetical protein
MEFLDFWLLFVSSFLFVLVNKGTLSFIFLAYFIKYFDYFNDLLSTLLSRLLTFCLVFIEFKDFESDWILTFK